jgi:uncharacterized protein (TIGR00297 family)
LRTQTFNVVVSMKLSTNTLLLTIYFTHMSSEFWPITAILLVAAWLSVRLGKLTVSAGLTGVIVGLMVFLGASYTGIFMLTTFFILASGATTWGLNKKQRLGIAETDRGKRTTGQVIANGGVAAILGLVTLVFPARVELIQLMIAASFASATADTISSELGNVYGKKYYNVITLKRDCRGINGVISLEGTLMGFVGSVCIAIVYSLVLSFDHTFSMIVIAGTIGNLADSVLGATLERKHYLNNNAVNFLNTAIAATVALIFFLF